MPASDSSSPGQFQLYVPLPPQLLIWYHTIFCFCQLYFLLFHIIFWIFSFWLFSFSVLLPKWQLPPRTIRRRLYHLDLEVFMSMICDQFHFLTKVKIQCHQFAFIFCQYPVSKVQTLDIIHQTRQKFFKVAKSSARG